MNERGLLTRLAQCAPRLQSIMFMFFFDGIKYLVVVKLKKQRIFVWRKPSSNLKTGAKHFEYWILLKFDYYCFETQVTTYKYWSCRYCRQYKHRVEFRKGLRSNLCDATGLMLAGDDKSLNLFMFVSSVKRLAISR